MRHSARRMPETPGGRRWRKRLHGCLFPFAHDGAPGAASFRLPNQPQLFPCHGESEPAGRQLRRGFGAGLVAVCAFHERAPGAGPQHFEFAIHDFHGDRAGVIGSRQFAFLQDGVTDRQNRQHEDRECNHEVHLEVAAARTHPAPAPGIEMGRDYHATPASMIEMSARKTPAISVPTIIPLNRTSPVVTMCAAACSC